MTSCEDETNVASVGVSKTHRAAEKCLPDRRAVVRGGLRLAFAAPILSTFFAAQAYAGNYSCYVNGHQCNNPGPDPEPCCATLTCKADGGSPTGFSCLP
ncbi:MAG: hypothetical protein IID42_11995 [Planctomycetes bacterium]|nr:hypothetical protein [Planctomycetota bacterium]